MIELNQTELKDVNGGLVVVVPPAVKAIAAAVGAVGGLAGITAWILN